MRGRGAACSERESNGSEVGKFADFGRCAGMFATRAAMLALPFRQVAAAPTIVGQVISYDVESISDFAVVVLGLAIDGKTTSAYAALGPNPSRA
jgi:hypothetical protein